MLNSHFVEVHVVFVGVFIVLELGLKSVEGIFENCAAFGVTLLIHSKVFLGLHILTIKYMLYFA